MYIIINLVKISNTEDKIVSVVSTHIYTLVNHSFMIKMMSLLISNDLGFGCDIHVVFNSFKLTVIFTNGNKNCSC